MKLSEIGELSLLAKIRERFKAVSTDILVGIGDDSAAVVPHDQMLLLTTDMMVEDSHFDLSFTTFFQLGFKIVSVNVSDIYAMGGTPRFILLDLAVPGDTKEDSIEDFFDGVRKAMNVYHLNLIGGDLSAAKSLTIAATLVGYAKKPVKRRGARPGDRIYVTGFLGDSACGLELLKRMNIGSGGLKRGEGSDLKATYSKYIKDGLTWKMVEPLIKRHLMPEARNPAGIAKTATSMIDVSDGLFIDLSRLCDESGVGAEVFMRQVPVSPQMKRAASAMGLDAYALATAGGEDYELLFTAPPGRKVDALCIGEITESDKILIDRNGIRRRFSYRGYEHWR